MHYDLMFVLLAAVVAATVAVEQGPTVCAASTAEAGTLKRRVLSEHPRIYLLEGFLSSPELAHLITMASELGVLLRAPGEPPDGYHQDYIPASRYKDDTILAEIEQRLSLLANVPFVEGSSHRISLAVRNATAGGLANVHHDHKASAQVFPVREMLAEDQGPTANMLLGELHATLLGYLEQPESGGETIFPCACNRTAKSCRAVQQACRHLYEEGLLDVHPGPGVKDQYLQKPRPEVAKKVAKSKRLLIEAGEKLCAGSSDQGLKITPRPGRAVFFFSNSVRGTADPRAWHGVCKVTKGRKLTMQRFVYAPEADEETGQHATVMLKL